MLSITQPTYLHSLNQQRQPAWLLCFRRAEFADSCLEQLPSFADVISGVPLF